MTIQKNLIRTILGVSLLGVGTAAREARAATPTDAEVCTAVSDWRTVVDGKMANCDMREKLPSRLSRSQCMKKVATCKVTSKRWIRDAVGLQTPKIMTLTMCTGSGTDWWTKEFSPVVNDTYDEMGTFPNDPGCELLTHYGWRAMYQNYTININNQISVPSKVDVNVHASGDVTSGSTTKTTKRTNSEVTAPQTEPESKAKLFILDPEAGPSRDRFHLSALGSFGGYSGTAFGVGALLGIPVSDGIIPALNDGLAVEVGARMTFVDHAYGTGSFLTLMGGVRWDFYLSTDWSVYVAARLSPAISFNYVSSRFLVVGGATGVHWRLSDAMALRVELDGSNYGGALNAGVSFFF